VPTFQTAQKYEYTFLPMFVTPQEHRIGKNIGLGVGVPDTSEICSDWKMVPLPGFEFHGRARLHKIHGEHANKDQSQ